jgi:hypothetical protein
MHPTTIKRIKDFQKGNGVENFSERVKQLISTMNDIHLYQRLPEWLACYVVYG